MGPEKITFSAPSFVGASKLAGFASLDAPTKEGAEKVGPGKITFSAPSFVGASKLASFAGLDAPSACVRARARWSHLFHKNPGSKSGEDPVKS